MDISLIFVIVIMFYFCVVFPLQMRRYIHIRQHRQRIQRAQTTNEPCYTTRTVAYQNNNISSEQPDHQLGYGVSHTSGPGTESQSDDAIAAARHLEAEHRQQIIDMQREIEQQAIRRHEERLSHPNTPHIPSRLINSSTIRSSIYTITSGSAIGVSNSSVNYPFGPPLPSDGDGVRHIHFPDRSNSKDDELPSYDQAVAFDSTTTSVTIRRF